MKQENKTSFTENLSRFSANQTMWVLNNFLNAEEEYHNWAETNDNEDTSVEKFFGEKRLKADAEYKARHGYDPPKNGWD